MGSDEEPAGIEGEPEGTGIEPVGSGIESLDNGKESLDKGRESGVDGKEPADEGRNSADEGRESAGVPRETADSEKAARGVQIRRENKSKGSRADSMYTLRLLPEIENPPCFSSAHRSGKSDFQQGQIVIQTYPVGKAQ